MKEKSTNNVDVELQLKDAVVINLRKSNVKIVRRGIEWRGEQGEEKRHYRNQSSGAAARPRLVVVRPSAANDECSR